MTLTGASLGLLGPLLVAGGGLLAALYILKLRRRRIEVPYAHLWRRVTHDTESTALWRRLRRMISLIIQLCVLFLLCGALAAPVLGPSQRGRTLAILIDVSASMQATDGTSGRTRLAEAKDEARKLLRGLGGADRAMLIALDGRPSPVTGFEGIDVLGRAIFDLAARDTPADLEGALRLAKDALSGQPRPTLVLIGDGAYDPGVLARVHLAPSATPDLADIDLSGIDLRFIPVGHSGDNVAITAFAVRRYRANQTSYEVLVEVTSFRDHKAPLRLELVEDGEVVEVERLELEPGQRLIRRYPNLSGQGSHLQARLRPLGNGRLDDLPVDDEAFALLPPRQKRKVLLVSNGNLFLEGVLLLDENVEVEKIGPARYTPAALAGFDAVVFDRFVPDEPVKIAALYLDPAGPHSPFSIRGQVAAPLVTDVAREHPLMRWVTLKDLNIARASSFRLAPGDTAVASSLREPILVARDREGLKSVALGFDLKQSDLPLRVAFPVLIMNALEWFAGADTNLVSSYSLGQVWHLPASAGSRELEVRDPDGRIARVPVRDGRATFYGERAGYYGVHLGNGATRLFAANLANAAESRILPQPLSIDGQRVRLPDPGHFGIARELWATLVLLVLGLVLGEWVTYNRRVTV